MVQELLPLCAVGECDQAFEGSSPYCSQILKNLLEKSPKHVQLEVCMRNNAILAALDSPDEKALGGEE